MIPPKADPTAAEEQAALIFARDQAGRSWEELVRAPAWVLAAKSEQGRNRGLVEKSGGRKTVSSSGLGMYEYKGLWYHDSSPSKTQMHYEFWDVPGLLMPGCVYAGHETMQRGECCVVVASWAGTEGVWRPSPPSNVPPAVQAAWERLRARWSAEVEAEAAAILQAVTPPPVYLVVEGDRWIGEIASREEFKSVQAQIAAGTYTGCKASSIRKRELRALGLLDAAGVYAPHVHVAYAP